MKPRRGVASENVFLCHSEEEVAKAGEVNFNANTWSTYNEKPSDVLIQEYLPGAEYVVDSVSRNGVHKA